MQGEIINIAVVVLTALSFGLFFIRLGQTPIVGYILAGVALGPSCFHFIKSKEAVQLLSELGIMFLLFAIGLNLSFEKVKKIWRQAVGVNILSAAMFFGAFYAAGILLKLDIYIVTILTFCAMSSSTAVTVKALEKANISDDNVIDYTMGMTIIQDLISLLMIIALQFMGKGAKISTSSIALEFFIISLIALAVWLLKHYKTKVNFFLRYVKQSQEILSICTVAACVSGAVISIMAGVSPAFGSFVVGLALGNSVIKEELQAATSILEEILLMTFFLSIGLLVELPFILSNFFIILVYVLFIMIGKTTISIAIFKLFKFRITDAFLISVLLGHLGEFSFVLINEGVHNNLLSDYSSDLLISITAVSLSISPFWLIIAERAKKITSKVVINSTFDLLKYASQKEVYITKKFFMFLKAIVIFIYIKMANVGKYSADLFRASKKRRD